jgi:hypothetical protein
VLEIVRPPEKTAEEKRAELGFRPWRRLGVEPGKWYGPDRKRVFQAVGRVDSRYWVFRCRRGHERPILAQHVVRGGIRSCSECNKGAKPMGKAEAAEKVSHKDAVIAARAWLEHRTEHRTGLEKELASIKARETEIMALLDAMGVPAPDTAVVGQRLEKVVSRDIARVRKGWPKGKPRAAKKAAPKATSASPKEASAPAPAA